MVFGMATTKVTVTLDDDQLAAVRRIVASGKSPSVSGFVQHAVGIALNDVAGWRAMLTDALEQTGGALTKKETAWADRALGLSRRSSKPRKRAA